MGIIKDLNQVKRLTNGSLGAIVENSNNNFIKLSSAFRTFLGNLNYDEVNNDVTFNTIKSSVINLSNSLTMNQNGSRTLLIDSQGRISAKSIITEVAQTKRQRFTEFPDRPEAGVIGEVIYTGPNSNIEEGLWLYTEYAGWVRLDGDSGGTGTCCELKDLPDVQLDMSPGPQDRDVLMYNAQLQKWVNGQPNGGGPAPTPMIYEVTYSELSVLISLSKLVPFAYYIITDYATAGYYAGTNDYFQGPEEKLVVQAMSEIDVSEDAFSFDYPTDIIKYVRRRNVTSFISGYQDCCYYGQGPSYTIVPNYKGQIVYRKCTLDNIEGAYDWRNWRLRLYKSNVSDWDSGIGYNPGDVVKYNGYIYGILTSVVAGFLNPENAPWFRITIDDYIFTDSLNLYLGPNQTQFQLTVDYADYEDVYVFNKGTVSLIKNISLKGLDLNIFDAAGANAKFATEVPLVSFKVDPEGMSLWQDIDVSGIVIFHGPLFFDITGQYMMGVTIQSENTCVGIDFGKMCTKVFISSDELNTATFGDRVTDSLLSIISSGSARSIAVGNACEHILISGDSTKNLRGHIQIENQVEDSEFTNSEYFTVERDSEKLKINESSYFTIGKNCNNLILESATKFSIDDKVHSKDFSPISSISSHKKIFEREDNEVIMTYYDSTNALVVVDPTV